MQYQQYIIFVKFGINIALNEESKDIFFYYYTEEELKMKTYFRWCLIFSLILTFVSILTINSYAGNNDSFSNLEAQLGIYAGGNYTNTSISNIIAGRVIEATIVDPSKIGGCLKGFGACLKRYRPMSEWVMGLSEGVQAYV